MPALVMAAAAAAEEEEEEVDYDDGVDEREAEHMSSLKASISSARLGKVRRGWRVSPRMCVTACV